MNDEQNAAPSEAAQDVVQSQETETPEAAESTEGQVEAPPAESEGETPDPPEKSESARRRERRKAQMETLRGEKQAAEEELSRAREREARIVAAADAAQPPKEGDFADYNEYLVAAGAYHAAQTMDARETTTIKAEQDAAQQRLSSLEQREKQELAQDWASSVNEAKARYSDFEAVVFSAPIDERLGDLIARSDNAADLAYTLAADRPTLTQISQLSDVEMAREIGRIEATMTSPQPRVISEAPDPITPVRPKAAASVKVETMTNDEYRAARAAGKI